jgi:hypothetical protein
VSFATSGPIAKWKDQKVESQTSVHAIVGPYAQACWDNIPFIEFEGAAKEENTADQTANLSYCYNTPVNLSFKATALKLVAGADVITTTYTIGGVPVEVKDGVNAAAIGKASSSANSPRGTEHIAVEIKGKLGEINDQAAGKYESTITVTVTSPLDELKKW